MKSLGEFVLETVSLEIMQKQKTAESAAVYLRLSLNITFIFTYICDSLLYFSNYSQYFIFTLLKWNENGT